MEVRDTRNGEWYWVNTAINACKHISYADKSVYGALATFAGYKEIRPSFEIIAKRSATSLRQAKRSIKSLLAVKIISVENFGRKGLSNVYLLLKVPKGCEKCQNGTTNKKGQNKPKEVPKVVKRSAKFAPHIDKEVDKEIDSDFLKESYAAKKIKEEIALKVKFRNQSNEPHLTQNQIK